MVWRVSPGSLLQRVPTGFPNRATGTWNRVFSTSSTLGLRLLIVGGVGGGASAATRARRLSEAASITILERGPLVSYANCGIPYTLGGVIERETDLLLQTPSSLRARYNIDVRVNTEAISICSESQTVAARNTQTGEELTFPYDKLVLSLGAEPVRPLDVQGLDLDGVFCLQTIQDLQLIKRQIYDRGARSAVVIGGGYLGLETAENLVSLGLDDVSIVEKAPQLFSSVDPELASHIQLQLQQRGVEVHLNSELKAVRQAGRTLEVSLDNGKEPLSADLVILALGVRARLDLARSAGLRLGRWGVQVDEWMRTSLDNVYAVGDMVEVHQPQLQQSVYLPLAGPANRQGRIAANHIFGRSSTRASFDLEAERGGYRGSVGTSICKIFGLTVASTGLSESDARARGIASAKAVTIHRASHATYYPGASQLTIKLTFDPEKGGKLIGGQVLGSGEAVAKRVDVLATALQAGRTVFDIEEAELAYAPPYGSAKDPLNIAGAVAANYLRGEYHFITPKELQGDVPNYHVIDVRTRREYQYGHIAGAKNFPIDELRQRLEELREDVKEESKPLVLYCGVGFRSYLGYRILVQNGFGNVFNLDGGITSWLSHEFPVER